MDRAVYGCADGGGVVRRWGTELSGSAVYTLRVQSRSVRSHCLIIIFLSESDADGFAVILTALANSHRRRIHINA